MRVAPARTVLAVDLGTQSLRIGALRSDGERLWSWSAPVDSRIGGQTFEQSTLQWAELLTAGLQAAQAAGVRPDAVAAAGPLAGYVALDREGHALTSAVMYSDKRSAVDVAGIESALGAAQPARMLPSDPLAHWLRLKREQPDIAAKTASFLDATGWLNFFLCGQTTLNAYTAMRLYSPALRQSVGAADGPFGRVVAIGQTIGSLRPVGDHHSSWTGVPVIAATFDSKCAYLASGISRPGDATDISGTVTSFGVLSAQPVDDPQRRIYSVPFGERWLVRGSTACAGSALEWIRGQLLQENFDELDTAAAAVAPGANGLTFLPYLAGERAPLWDPDARGALLGLSLSTTRADIARAVYEGLALSLGHIAQTMRECGVAIREVRLAGGLARNDLLSQMKADILGAPMVRLADHELTTLGLAVIASVALGDHADAASAAPYFTAVQRRFEPEANAELRYAPARARYLACSNALRATFPLFAGGSDAKS